MIVQSKEIDTLVNSGTAVSSNTEMTKANESNETTPKTTPVLPE